MLDHEKLDVYQCAIRFLALAHQILQKIPRGNASLSDQLKRAAISVPLNIAEGAGKTSPADKRKFFSIARGSAMECGAVLDACSILELTDAQYVTEGKDLLIRIVSMLSKLSR